MDTLRDQQVLIVGLGESGLASAQWCAQHGAHLTVLDTRAQPPGLAALRAFAPDAVVLQAAEALDIATFDRIIASPGLSPHAEPLRTILQAAQAVGKTVDSEIELFAQALAALAQTHNYRPRVVGITGTNGKTTTTALTRLLIDAAGWSVQMAGNVRPAALHALLDAVQNKALPAVWVLELSSFQLQLTRSLRCDVACVLNVTPDHLDWHASFDEYAQAKQAIFSPATIRIINDDDAQSTKARAGAVRTVGFSLQMPGRAGDYGLSQDGGLRWLCRAEPLPFEPGRRKTDTQPFIVKNLMPVDALRIRGLHNVSNALAALAIASALELPLAPLLHALSDYRGEPHRTEWIATLGGVDYFDDSKGTNVGATVAALTGLNRTVVLIAGGDGKGQDFTPLVPAVQRHARAVVLLGQDAAALELILRDAAPCTRVADLPAAVECAAHLAHSGDAVLLSPACASLDMFRDYTHRAAVFRQAVQELSLQAGQPC